MNGYDLSRQWFDFAFDKSECKVQHTALYFWIIELNNRLGWKKQFGLPTSASMEGLSIGDKRTFISALKDLHEWGFIKIIQEAKNQFQSCIIEICHSEITTAQTSALDSAMIRQADGLNNDATIGKRTSGTPIDKQRNNETKKQEDINIHFDVFWDAYDKKVGKKKAEKKWESLSDLQRELAIKDIPNYLASLDDRKYQKDPLTYLNGECWNDERSGPKSVILISPFRGVASTSSEIDNEPGPRKVYL